jgi:hypothetical protein
LHFLDAGNVRRILKEAVEGTIQFYIENTRLEDAQELDPNGKAPAPGASDDIAS